MIVKMKKVKLAVLASEKDEFLLAMQKGEFIEIISSSGAKAGDALDLASDISRTFDTLEEMNRRKKEAKIHSPLKRAEVVANERDLIEECPKTKEAIARIDALSQEITALKREIEHLKVEAFDLLPWRLLSSPLSSVHGNADVSVFCGLLPTEAALKKLAPFLKEAGAVYEIEGYRDKTIGVLVASRKVDREKVADTLARHQFTSVTLPSVDYSAGVLYEKLIKERKAKIERLKHLEKEILKDAEATEAIGIEADRLDSLANRSRQAAVETKDTRYYEGWIRADREKEFRATLDKTLSAYALEVTDPTPDDVVPTCLENNKFVKPFESITNMFSVPSYHESDPNPLMSVWYWLLFGLMVGDLGYGLLLAIVSTLFIKLKKPKGGMRSIVKILQYASITTALSGIFYNSFFGFSLFGSDSIFGASSIFGTGCFMTKITIPPMDAASAMKLLVFSVAIGMLHLIAGLIMKAIEDIGNHDIAGMLAHDASWIMIMLGLAGFASGIALKISVLKIIGLVFCGIGIIFILIFSGIGVKGFFKKITATFSGIYSITSYLSDLLSYTRIMALVMASAAIAYVMNLLAGMVWSIPVIGVIFGLLIYLVGHVFNLVLGLLSAYVHDCRLQYIEFYGKFYTGSGHLFRPLAFTSDHIDEVR